MLTEKVQEQFVPIVLKMLHKHPPFKGHDIRKMNMTVVVTEESRDGLAHVLSMSLTLNAEICAAELAAIAKYLDRFCTYEDGLGSYRDPILIDGIGWVIGDGDDSGAVTFHDNAFHIWIRHFK